MATKSRNWNRMEFWEPIPDKRVDPSEIRQAPDWHPLYKLYTAILFDAIRQRDVEWMQDDSEHLFSFENTCIVLGLDPDAVKPAIVSGPNARLKLAASTTVLRELFIRKRRRRPRKMYRQAA